jgi:uncharacterized protein (DUF885 family)
VSVAGATPTELADRFAHAVFEDQPLMATYMGVGGFDDRMPDLSGEARERLRRTLLDIYLEAFATDAEGDRDAVVLETVKEWASIQLGVIDSSPHDFSVSTLPFAAGPSQVQFMLSQTVVSTPEAAAGYLTRCRGVATYLAQLGEMLRAHAARGRTPVAPLVEQTLRMVEQLTASPEAAVGLTPARGAQLGEDAQRAWQSEVAQVARDVVRPALAAHADLLRELLPLARPGDAAGLVHVPGGMAAYRMAVRDGTTLSLEPEDIHRIGLDELARCEERIRELGSRAFGVQTVQDVLEQLRNVPPVADDASLLQHTVEFVRRAEAGAAPVLPGATPPCDVVAMPDAVGDAGTPPMYRPPTRDGTRSGAYMFNTRRPGPAATFLFETTTLHETVPGHHAQFALLQEVPDLPLLLSSFNVVAHGEGWGLYAELLSDEIGLFSDDVQRLGLLVSHAWRAVRLVVDTGIHALGWSRDRALQFALAHTAFPEQFMSAEIDRYIAWPGQALGYLIGLREILRLRERARAADRGLDLRQFHAAVLRHGSLPLRTLRSVVERELAIPS